MKKMKLYACLLAVLTALMFAGCTADGVTNWKNPVPTVEEVAETQNAEPTENARATEPAEPGTTLPAVAWRETPKAEQPAGFEPGDTAWIVLHYDDMAGASTHSAVVIAEIPGYLITAPQYCGNGADLELMWDLILRSDDGRQCLDIWPIGDCYESREDAEAAVNREMDG